MKVMNAWLWKQRLPQSTWEAGAGAAHLSLLVSGAGTVHLSLLVACSAPVAACPPVAGGTQDTPDTQDTPAPWSPSGQSIPCCSPLHRVPVQSLLCPWPFRSVFDLFPEKVHYP